MGAEERGHGRFMELEPWQALKEEKAEAKRVHSEVREKQQLHQKKQAEASR